MRIRTTAAAVLAGAALAAGAGTAAADTDATGVAVGNSGVLSGNVIQVPIDMHINACGNSRNEYSLLNPAFGNVCVNQ